MLVLYITQPFESFHINYFDRFIHIVTLATMTITALL